MKSLVIVDVQKEFDKFIQHDLVDELYEYAEKFDKVYQIWDTNKGAISPTYSFPNEVYNTKKKYGKNHFSPKVKKFIEKVTNETPEGNKFKLSDENGYIVRVDNNHGWFYVNPDLVELVEDLENDKVILVGGADNECLEDVFQMFIAFGVNVKINNKYVYSAKTSPKVSINENNKLLKFNNFKLLESNGEYMYNTVIFEAKNKNEYDIIIDNLIKNDFKCDIDLIIRTYPIYLFANINYPYFSKYVSYYYPPSAIRPLKDTMKSTVDRKIHQTIFDYIGSKFVIRILKYGYYKPMYGKRNIER